MFNFNLLRTLSTKIKNLKEEIDNYNILYKKILKYCNNKIETSSSPILSIPIHSIRGKVNINLDEPKLNKLINIICEENPYIKRLGAYVIIIKH